MVRITKGLRICEFVNSYVFVIRTIIFLIFLIAACSRKKNISAPSYASLNDTVQYVGMNTCRQCHQNIYDTFIHTGMGMSFDKASHEKTSARFGDKEIIHE